MTIYSPTVLPDPCSGQCAQQITLGRMLGQPFKKLCLLASPACLASCCCAGSQMLDGLQKRLAYVATTLLIVDQCFNAQAEWLRTLCAGDARVETASSTAGYLMLFSS